MRPVGSDVKMLEPRVDITPHEIAQVVAAFYGRVRQHPVLGPIFFSILSRDASIWRPGIYNVRWFLVLISDGNSEIGAHVRSNVCYLIC